jgi:hypothetical protein
VEIDYYLAIRAIKEVGAWSGFKRLEWLMYRCDIDDDDDDEDRYEEEETYVAEDCFEWRSAIAELRRAWVGREIEINTWEGKAQGEGVSDAPPVWTRCEYWLKEDATIFT